MTNAAIIDLETTSTDAATCEVVQCAVRVVSLPDFLQVGDDHVWLSRALGAIPSQASAVHGITADDLVGAPTFDEIAPDVLAVCGDAHCEIVVTFNGQAFDLPILTRYGVRIDAPHFDVYRVWQVARERKLSRSPEFARPCAHRYTGALGSAYAWATGHEPDLREHDAAADCEMTGAVAMVLVDAFGLVKCLEWTAGPLPGYADHESKIRLVDGCHVLAFGKYKGTPLQEIDKGYLSWMVRGDFHATTKDVVRRYLTRG